MDRSSIVYRTYVDILERELVTAMGCTEPIALAYCAAVARATLGALPERIAVEASGNIIKNVKSVVVPNTGGRRGIAAAAAIGALAGDAEAGLIGLPLEGERAAYLLLEYDGGKLHEKGTLALEYVPDDARTLLIDGLLYICGPGEVYVADPEEAELLAVVSNAVG